VSPARPKRPTVVVVTGLSGAGKSTALRALEDLSFFCVDNLPTALAPNAVELCERGGMTRVALGMDVRVRAFLGEVGVVVAKLEDNGRREVQLVFFDASDETLLRRFSETRRPHPLSTGDGGALAVLDGVRIERERLAPLRALATRVFDTTDRSVHELRREVLEQFGPGSGGAPRMVTRFVSFGFKFGAPVDADYVLDVRFLKNPYFVPGLRALPGTDPVVIEYVLSQEETREFLDKAVDLFEFVLPRCEREGKSYLTIAIGCTGGRHRSVVLSDEIARVLRGKLGVKIGVLHRDIDRGERQGPPSAHPDSVGTEIELKGLLSAPPPPDLSPPSTPLGSHDLRGQGVPTGRRGGR
jgi:RNase adapter protein RapZ